MDNQEPKDEDTRKTGGVKKPASKPALKNPRPEGSPDTPDTFGQSVEAGGVD
ncbi:MAG TPA: hypothetical protein VE981_21170 [Planctomycetota bacterium]|nr:hypothetical protein [Planctomycetota bacterium]